MTDAIADTVELSPRVFVSYSHADGYFILGGLIPRMRQEFGEDNVWVDDRLDNDPGKEWQKLILERIDWCDIFVYCISHDSLASPHCAKEYETARNSSRAIPIVPTIVRPKTDIPTWVSETQYQNFSHGLERGILDDDTFQRFVRGIRSAYAQLQAGTYLHNSALPDIANEPIEIFRVRSDMLAMEVSRCEQGVRAFGNYALQNEYADKVARWKQPPARRATPLETIDHFESHDTTLELKLPGEIDFLAGLLLGANERLASAAVATMDQARVFQQFVNLDWLRLILQATIERYPAVYMQILKALEVSVNDDNREAFQSAINALINDKLLEETNQTVANMLHVFRDDVVLEDPKWD